MDETVTGKVVAESVREGLRDETVSWEKLWKLPDGEVKLVIYQRNRMNFYVYINGHKNGTTFCHFGGCYDSESKQYDINYEYVSEEQFYSAVEALIDAQ